MPKAKVNSIEINFEINGSGVPLLLIHGNPFNRTIWDLQIEDFSKHFQVITPDLRGFGFSEVPLNRNTSFEDYATDMLCLMDFLGIKKLHLNQWEDKSLWRFIGRHRNELFQWFLLILLQD